MDDKLFNESVNSLHDKKPSQDQVNHFINYLHNFSESGMIYPDDLRKELDPNREMGATEFWNFMMILFKQAGKAGWKINYDEYEIGDSDYIEAYLPMPPRR